jgi:hypothetical protein
MATTLTLGTTDYALTNNSSFNSVTGLSLSNLGGNDAITIKADPGTAISGSAGAGDDTLTIATNLVGSAGTIITGGGGSDLLVVNAGVTLTGMNVEGGVGNDTIIMTGTMAGGSVKGNEGADYIALGSTSVIGGGQVQLDNATGGFGADTLLLGNLTAGAFNNSKINQFSRTNDTLLIADIANTTITSADWGTIAAGNYTGATLAAANTGSNADIAALATFLSNNGTANITII